MQMKALKYMSLGVLLMITIVAMFAPYFAPYDPHAISENTFSPPSRWHLLGTNDIGQDILSELIFGARSSLLIGFFAGFISIFTSVLIGIAAGWVGGKTEAILMSITTFFLTIPFVPTLIILATFSKPGIFTTSIILGVMTWGGTARLIRSETMLIKADEHISTIKAMGAKDFYIIKNHVLKRLLPLAIYRFVSKVKTAILSESSLAFIGLGSVVNKSWGSIIYHAHSRNALLTGSWVWWIAPAAFCICLISLSLMIIAYSTEKGGY